MKRLQGKVALITGGSAGIGRASAILFGSEGAKIVVADIDSSGGNETVRTISDNGAKAIYIKTDVTNPESVQDAIRKTIEEFGKLDILYNNAGGSVPEDGPITEVSTELWERTFSLNLFSTFLCCKYAIPVLIKNGGGSIILTSSITGLKGWRPSAYTAAKGAIISLTRIMAVDYAKYNIRVNCICPGVVLSERALKRLRVDPHFSDDLLPFLLLGYAEPKDIAYGALYLASDESRIVTGAIFPIDSGFMAVGRIDKTDLLKK